VACADHIPWIDHTTACPMAADPSVNARTELVTALVEAHRVRLGVPASLEPLVRAFARGERETGLPVERVLVDLKRLLAETVHGDAELFAKRVVGWAVAGYYHAARD
jgi:hypothetical protein